jgi:hypothetical protein
LSARSGQAAILLAAVTFALGLGLGTSIGPVTARLGPGETAAISTANPAPRHGQPMQLARPVEVLRVLDGDTFEARVHLWPGLTATTRVRLRKLELRRGTGFGALVLPVVD